jgi:hypothetical protein
MKKTSIIIVFAFAVIAAGFSQGVSEAQTTTTMWINHLDFLPGDPSVQTSFNAVNSGVGGGLSGLIIESTTTGEEAQGGGNKVVQKGLVVPPGYLISGVRVCYESDSTDTFISQIRLSQLQDPPSTADVVLDDGTDQAGYEPICANSVAPPALIDPALGGLRLSFRVNFGDTSDRIVLRGVALLLEPKADGDLETRVGDLETAVSGLQTDVADLNTRVGDLEEDVESFNNHTHTYLTGRGRGHNNTEATTGPLQISDDPVCLQKWEPCITDGECCSGKCKGPKGRKTCK